MPPAGFCLRTSPVVYWANDKFVTEICDGLCKWRMYHNPAKLLLPKAVMCEGLHHVICIFLFVPTTVAALKNI